MLKNFVEPVLLAASLAAEVHGGYKAFETMPGVVYLDSAVNHATDPQEKLRLTRELEEERGKLGCYTAERVGGGVVLAGYILREQVKRFKRHEEAGRQ